MSKTFSDCAIDDFILDNEENGVREIITPIPVLVSKVINSHYGHLGVFDEKIENIDGGRRHTIVRLYKFPDCSSLTTKQVFEKMDFIPGKGYNAIIKEKAYIVPSN